MKKRNCIISNWYRSQGYTQTTFAKYLDVTKQRVYAWEKQGFVGHTSIQMVARKTGISIHDLRKEWECNHEIK